MIETPPKCMICGKALREENKQKLCSPCGNKTAYELIKKGYKITKND